MLLGLLIPVIGTALGASFVFFSSSDKKQEESPALSGFASGVMTAASVWSLLLPALEREEWRGRWSFLPVTVGVWLGIFLLLGISVTMEKRQCATSLSIPAIVIHNIPEGMAVGIAFAGCRQEELSFPVAMALATGIALQNIPEGTIVSLPLHAKGQSKGKAFLGGALSGAVELPAALFALWALPLAQGGFSVLLSFAAGTMLFVVAEELLPTASRTTGGLLAFFGGFSLMMAMDVALG